ncbi:MAG: phage terminase large subunit [Methanomicrobia archaeon]|nr:phage terminase large subunit [Methanomicrobia archaeon]
MSAGGTGTGARKSPGRNVKTIAVTPEAHAAITRRAEAAGTDRKTVASEAILAETSRRGLVKPSTKEHQIQLSKVLRGCDLFHFAREILDYDQLEEVPHHAWCQELEKRHKRSLWLEPRHTFKSTIFTKAYPIWRLLWNPELRILIVNDTAGNAQAFLSEIVNHYLRNEKLIALYEQIYHTIPLNPHTAKSKSIMLTTRTKNYSEPSIRTVGALGNIVSAHYDLIIVDDLCNIKDRESPAIRAKKKLWFQDLPSILTPQGELVIVGTHWHCDDLYSHIINQQLSPALADEDRYYIQRESCYLENTTCSRFPTIFSDQKLQSLAEEKGTALFACQYLNSPISPKEQIFTLEHLHTIPKARINLQNAEAFAFCDPSLGANDFSAIITLLRYHDFWIVYHCILSRMRHSQLIEKLIELHQLFQYRLVGIEANSLNKARSDTEPCTFELTLRHQQRQVGVSMPYELVWHSARKEARIQDIEPYITNGQLLFLESHNQDYPELIDQLIQFPAAAHDDGPDALAGAIKLLQNTQKAKKSVLIPRAH